MLSILALAFAMGGGLTSVLEQQVFSPPTTGAGGFGNSICIRGNTLVVGSDSAVSGGIPLAGSAHVYERRGTWVYAQKLTPKVPEGSGYFGSSIALSDEFLAIGAFGAGQVHVYRFVGGAWKLHALVTSDDTPFNQNFGISVALEGDLLAIGVPGDDTLGTNAGAVFLYKCGATGVTLTDKLFALNGKASKWLGWSVSMSDGRLLVGSPAQSGKGTAYIFVRGATGWTQEQQLKPTGIKTWDSFGSSVSLSGDVALIGARDTFWGGGRAGAAYIFERGTTWTQQVQLLPPTSTFFQLFGSSVSIDGDLAVVGAPWDPAAGVTSGTAYLYSRVAGQWIGQGLLVPPGTVSGDRVGTAVSLSGATPALTATGDKGNSPEFSIGSASIFSLDASSPSSYCTAGSSASGCNATLSASGSASTTAASGFVLSAATVEGAKDGLFFFGTSGAAALPWGNGTSLQCVLPPVTRLGLMTGSGTPGQCDGAFAQDLNATWCATCPAPAKNPGPGAVVQAQLWYRDPLNTSNPPSSLSDAIEFALAP